ncbi:MAG: DUF438 domain-containing protein [Asgard group archaeon]|nr:DUF438 domain-containing protein [Asgard group archaeon]
MLDKKAKLKKLIEQLNEGMGADKAKADFKEIIRDTESDEIAKVEEELVKDGLPREKLNKLCDVHLAVFNEKIGEQKVLVTLGHPISILMEEHRLLLAFAKQLQEAACAIKTANKRNFSAVEKDLNFIRELSAKIKDSSSHYLREENALFPFIEKHGLTEPPAQMWIDHDKIRAIEKRLYKLLEQVDEQSIEFDDFAIKIDATIDELAKFLATHFFKENNILFPSSLKLITDDEWLEIRKDFDDISYCSFTPKEVLKEFGTKLKMKEKLPEEIIMEGMIEFETGPLPLNVLEPIFNTLPIDITFVDPEDKVRFFSKGDERIFVRAKSVIGRSVQNCHPQKSVHVVNQILNDFRDGKRKVAEFWIDLQGRKIHIRYFAVHDKNGKYLGCLEVSQDITEIQKLEGQKRLLD